MKGDEDEMKQIEEFFGEHVSCTAAVLVPGGDASGLHRGHNVQRGSGEACKEDKCFVRVKVV